MSCDMPAVAAAGRVAVTVGGVGRGEIGGYGSVTHAHCGEVGAPFRSGRVDDAGPYLTLVEARFGGHDVIKSQSDLLRIECVTSADATEIE